MSTAVMSEYIVERPEYVHMTPEIEAVVNHSAGVIVEGVRGHLSLLNAFPPDPRKALVLLHTDEDTHLTTRMFLSRMAAEELVVMKEHHHDGSYELCVPSY